MSLTEPQIRRYSRHVLLPDVGGLGQERLLAATVPVELDGPAAIVTATYLAAAGVGILALRGGDRPVTEEDVASGIALGQSDLGRPVGQALSERLSAINPDVRVVSVPGQAPQVRPAPVADALVEGGLEACRIIHEITRR